MICTMKYEIAALPTAARNDILGEVVMTWRSSSLRGMKSRSNLTGFEDVGNCFASARNDN